MSGELVAALAKAQAAFGHVKKSKTNPHFKSSYADLADVIAAVVPALNAQGIALVQPIEDGDLVTRLLFGDEAIESRVSLNLDVKPQELGSQLTYLRRYALSALVGVAAEDDDDGNAAKDVRRAPVNVDRSTGEARPPLARTLSPKVLGARMNGLSYDGVKKVQFVSAVVGEARKLDDCSPQELAAVAAELDRVDAGETPHFTPAGAVLASQKDKEPF